MYAPIITNLSKTRPPPTLFSFALSRSATNLVRRRAPSLGLAGSVAGASGAAAAAVAAVAGHDAWPDPRFLLLLLLLLLLLRHDPRFLPRLLLRLLLLDASCRCDRPHQPQERPENRAHFSGSEGFFTLAAGDRPGVSRYDFFLCI